MPDIPTTCDPPYALDRRAPSFLVDYSALEVAILKHLLELEVLESPYSKQWLPEKPPRTIWERVLGPDPY